MGPSRTARTTGCPDYAALRPRRGSKDTVSHNPFATSDLARGYALARPPLHPLIVDRIWVQLNRQTPVTRAMDVGCGAGLSTAPLRTRVPQVVGLEPAEMMLGTAHAIAPGARFVVAGAESLPFRTASFDLLTAAGSLNYVPLDRFFPEASRVLTSDGVLVVYDFKPGREFPDDPALDDWYTTFVERYPAPPGEATPLDPDRLRSLGRGFDVASDERFAIDLVISPSAYLAYVLTEANVSAAVRRGVSRDDIGSWCEPGIREAFGDAPRAVMFRGYIAWMRPTRTD